MVSTTKLSRRSVLGMAAGALAGGVSLSGCSGGGSNGESRGSGRLVMVTVTERGNVDSDAFYQQWLETFTERTGIEVELRTYPIDQYANSVQLLFAQGSPPDVFRSAGTAIEHPVPYVRGWEHPLTDYVTDQWVANWPEGSMAPEISGLHVGDELYAAPFAGNGRCRVLYCNIDLLNKYGISEPPRTWQDFEEAAMKVTTDSGGEVHGFYPITTVAMGELHSTAGPDLLGLGPAGLNLKTGEPGAADPGTVAMIEMMQRLNQAGAFIPGWESQQAQAPDQMWSAFAQDKVAMSISTNFHYREMLRLRDDLPLVMAEAPVPDDGRAGYNCKPYVFRPFWHMGAETEQPEAAWELLAFLSSPELMLAYYELAKRNPPALPQSAFGDQLDEWDKRMFEIEQSTVRLGPTPTMKSVDAAEVEGRIAERQPQPNYAETQLLAVTRGSDYAEMAAQFDIEYEQAIEEEIASAEQDELDVSRDTFVFPDWDPLSDYAPAGTQRPDWN